MENPRTGEVIEFPGQPGNVEFLLNGQWNNAFWWRRDSIRFKVPSSCKIYDGNDPFWSMVIELCSYFCALTRDEFGDDFYDPATGTKVRS